VSDTYEELFAEADARLKKQEIPDEWGYLRQTEEGERILARYLGRDTLPLFDDAVFYRRRTRVINGGGTTLPTWNNARPSVAFGTRRGDAMAP
jgi:hypothetical protein